MWLVLNLRYFIFCTCLFLSLGKVQSQEKGFNFPELENKKSWSLVLLPDPQTYMKFGRNQGIFDIITAWIIENKDDLNINMVLCTGDLVEQNNVLKGVGANGNQSSINQWRSLDKSISRLDNQVRYVLAAGNHDFGYHNVLETRHTFYDKYITADRNSLNEEMLREYFYNTNGMPTLANAISEFIDPNGIPYLFLNLEFAPRNEVLDWAKRIIDQEKYKSHRVIVLTHSYMGSDNERFVTENYPIENCNYGQAIWEKLIYPSRNVSMVVAGHIGSANNPQGHLAYKEENKKDGKKVVQMVFNAQALGGGWAGNGGDGWLRYLEFLPNGKTIKVKTFSPFFVLSPSTQHLAWRTENYDEFEIILE